MSQNFQSRNKYNTLTPAEAKKLNRFLFQNGKQPVRTASVLQRPRPPPIMVTDLDSASLELKSSSRHSINYGRSHTISRTYGKNIYSTGPYQRPGSLNDSQSNLSYRSSIDTSASGGYGSMRLQTVSVDLGNPTYGLRSRRGSIQSARTTAGCGGGAAATVDYQSNKLSDESFASARSEISSMDFERTPTKSSHTTSKMSLSSSTYKVFQSPFNNFKRLFRHMPRPFANEPVEKTHQGSTKSVATNANESLEESISKICLNVSQSPPVCPPPPGELKSMPYLIDSISYSNYDDFTKSRNENNFKNLYNPSHVDVFDGPSVDGAHGDNDDDHSWQLTSLPVSYERNLTTVVEEKQNNPSVADCYSPHELIQPPVNFDYNLSVSQQQRQQSPMISKLASSSQSLASTATNDSAVDEYRKAATAFRFSYAQPVASPEQVKDIGLPPRMPPNEPKQPDTSSGNSSNTSSQLNGMNGTGGQQLSLLLEQLDKNSSLFSDGRLADNNNDDDPDTTILSETSTIQGDSSSTMFANKVAELERTVVSLKNKLLAKEKELTELQLDQLHSAYTIDKLKSQNNKLERENTQLKSMLIKTNNKQLLMSTQVS